MLTIHMPLPPLTGHSHEDPGSEIMYPPYLVLATSLLGLAATQRLWACDAMPQWAAWVVSAIYTAKLSMLLLPEAYLVLPTGLLLLTAASPMYLHKAPDTAGRRLRSKPWQGLAHVLAAVTAVLLARFALFDVLQWVLMGRPSEAVLVGSLLLAMAAACVPLVVRCYSSSQVGVVRVLCTETMQHGWHLGIVICRCQLGHEQALCRC